MHKYELYEIDTYMVYNETLIAKSNDLEKLREYAKSTYLYPDKDFHSEELPTISGGYRYDNGSGGYHGAPYYPSAIIRKAEEDFIVID